MVIAMWLNFGLENVVISLLRDWSACWLEFIVQGMRPLIYIPQIDYYIAKIAHAALLRVTSVATAKTSVNLLKNLVNNPNGVLSVNLSSAVPQVPLQPPKINECQPST